MNKTLYRKANKALKEYTPAVIAAIQGFKGKAIANEESKGQDRLFPEFMKAIPKSKDKTIVIDVFTVGDGALCLAVFAFLGVEDNFESSEVANKRTRLGYVNRKGILTSIAKS